MLIKEDAESINTLDPLYKLLEYAVDELYINGDDTLLEAVTVKPLIISRTKFRDFSPTGLVTPETDPISAKELYDDIVTLKRADRNYDYDVYRKPTQTIHFTKNGKKYIGKYGNFEDLVNKLPENEREQFKDVLTDERGRRLHGFIGYEYEGDEGEVPKVDERSMLHVLKHQTKDYMLSQTNNGSLGNSKSYRVQGTKSDDYPEIFDIGEKISNSDYQKKQNKLNGRTENKDIDKPKILTQNKPDTGYQIEPSGFNKKKALTLGVLGTASAGAIAYSIYKYANRDKNIIAKKITALRHIMAKYKKKMEQSHNLIIINKIKKVIAKIIEIIDKLLGFIHKGVNR
jgi:hypothetical protein